MRGFAVFIAGTAGDAGCAVKDLGWFGATLGDHGDGEVSSLTAESGVVEMRRREAASFATGFFLIALSVTVAPTVMVRVLDWLPLPVATICVLAFMGGAFKWAFDRDREAGIDQLTRFRRYRGRH